MPRKAQPVVRDLPSRSQTSPDVVSTPQTGPVETDSREDNLLGTQDMAATKIDINLIHTLPDGSHVIHLGDMEIWDGADLALLRETLVHLFHKMRSRRFGVDMTYVKYVPSGFFGMLFDWYEKGVEIQLYSPQPQVSGMLWFRRFFQPVGDDGFRLNSNFHAALGFNSVTAPNAANAGTPQYQATR